MGTFSSLYISVLTENNNFILIKNVISNWIINMLIISDFSKKANYKNNIVFIGTQSCDYIEIQIYSFYLLLSWI